MPVGDKVKKHPQVEKITKALLDGECADDIARWPNLDPRVSRVSIDNYRRFHVEPALKRAQVLSAIAHNNAQTVSNLTTMCGDNDKNDLTKEAFGMTVALEARQNRLRELQERHNRLREVIESRASAMEDEEAGTHTGVLMRRYKPNGVEYHVDLPLLKMLSEIEKQIAQETGQWNEGTSSSVSVNIVIPGGAVGHFDPAPRTVDTTFVDLALPVKR